MCVRMCVRMYVCACVCMYVRVYEWTRHELFTPVLVHAYAPLKNEATPLIRPLCPQVGSGLYTVEPPPLQGGPRVYVCVCARVCVCMGAHHTAYNRRVASLRPGELLVLSSGPF